MEGGCLTASTYPPTVQTDTPQARVAVLAMAALVAFSANSILARLALAGGLVDPASYGSIRIISGALTLALIARVRRSRMSGGTWRSGFFLALYAAPFAFAYVHLTAGTGALILFGTVQATMIGTGLAKGERPHPAEWAGLGIAIVGLVWLVLPGVDRAPLAGAAMMAVAGMAWGGYSLRGRHAIDPLAETAGNFMRASPFMVAASLITISQTDISPLGVGYAVLSGALASGLGYVVWYAALAGLSAMRAATIQLAVPVITAWAGVLILDENLTIRIALAGLTILGGVGLATFSPTSRK